jgi:ornithine carbamoyltransferase
MTDLRGRDLLSVSDLSSDELLHILELTKTLKAERGHAKWKAALSGKTLAMLFMKPSTRTRVSFDVAMYELGGHSVTLSPSDTQLSRGETVSDTGSVLSRYVSGIMARVTSHSILVDLAQHSSVPVINGLSDLEHPCQAIGDVFTMLEEFGHLGGISIAYLGDGNNVANSLILASALVGMEITVATPTGFEPKQDILATATEFAHASGGEVTIVTDPLKAVSGADVVYTDVWVSMGNEDEVEARKRALAPYQVNDGVMRAASEDAIFMHCLPAHRGEEVTDEVIDGDQSVVLQQAENRMHAQKAILLSLIG